MVAAVTSIAALVRRRWVPAVEVALLLLAGASVGLLSVLRPSHPAAAGALASAAPPGPPPPPPAGALVLAREDGPLAVALAVRPSGSRLELTGTVLDPNAFGVTGLRVSFAVGSQEGRTVRVDGAPCGSGCYRGEVELEGRPESVTLELSAPGRAPSSVWFAMPGRWPPVPAAGLVRRAARAIGHLRSLVTYQRLGTDATHVDYTTFVAVAPDRLESTTRDGSRSIVIGARGWTRAPGGRWQRSRQLPGPSIAPAWGTDTRVANAFLLGTTRLRGRSVLAVSFAVPQLLAWFTIWVDPSTFRTLSLRMTSNAHFMIHRYGSFDRPFRIEPPR